MNVRIEYCVQWNYEPRALSLREEIDNAFPDVTGGHVPGERGAFEVFVNDELIFSKLQEDRFPHGGEVVNLLKGPGYCRPTVMVNV